MGLGLVRSSAVKGQLSLVGAGSREGQEEEKQEEQTSKAVIKCACLAEEVICPRMTPNLVPFAQGRHFGTLLGGLFQQGSAVDQVLRPHRSNG